MARRVADIVMDTLADNGIDTCFCVVGGGAMHLNNALLKCDRISKIFNHHEQACAMAATGYARMSGKMAAVCVTAGPGGTNTINGVQGAWVDSLPMIIISGFPRWSTSALSTGLDIRVAGVQENDIVTMVSGITKYAVNLLNPQNVKREIQYAIDCAMSGRRGPVWVNIPLDIQALHIEDDELNSVIKYVESDTKDITDSLNTLNAWIMDSKRPCILTGSAIRTSNCEKLFLEFIDKTKIPVVGGFQQSDILYRYHERYYGMSGISSGRAGNFILQNADLILVLGNSLSHNQIGYTKEKFGEKARIVMVDIQQDESKKPGLKIDLFVHSTLKNFFEKSNIISRWNDKLDWIDYCERCYKRFPASELINAARNNYKDGDRVPQKFVWERLLDRTGNKAVFALGNSSGACGGLEEPIREKGQRVLVNYNCGSMGDDIPQAIGAYMAAKRDVYCVTGDGSIMMNIQELQTIKHNGFPIKIIIFSNDGYSAIRNTCTRYFNGEYVGCDSESGISFPDFKKLADAFGIDYKKCENIRQLDESLDWYIQHDGFCILEVVEEKNEIGVPVVASIMDKEGRFVTPPIHIMSPLISDEEVEKWMLD